MKNRMRIMSNGRYRNIFSGMGVKVLVVGYHQQFGEECVEYRRDESVLIDGGLQFYRMREFIKPLRVFHACYEPEGVDNGA